MDVSNWGTPTVPKKSLVLHYFSASCSETHPLHTVHRPSSGKCVDLACLASHRRLASWICGFAREKKRHKGLEVVLCPVNHPEPYWPMITPWIATIACSCQLHADFFMFNGRWFVGKTAGLVFKAASPESANRGWIAGWINGLIQLAWWKRIISPTFIESMQLTPFPQTFICQTP